MNICCGACGKEIVVEGGLLDGQHVLCPYCGEKTEYHRPRRVELPIGLEHASRQKPESPLKKPEEPRRKLSVIRPEVALPSDSQRMMEAMANAPHPAQTPPPRRSKEHPIYYSVAILMAGIAVAAIFMLNHSEKKELLRQQEEARQRDFERRLQEDELRAKREEQDRKRAEERRKAEEAKKQAREAEEKARQDALAAQRAKEEAARKRIEALRGIDTGVGALKIDYWRNSLQEDRPQSVTRSREYVCIQPREENVVKYMKILAEPEKEMKVWAYAEDGELVPMSNEVFVAELQRAPYMICSEGKGWLGGIDKNLDGISIATGSGVLNPAHEELGLLSDYLLQHSAKLDGISYGVSFATKNGKREFVRQVKFGETVSAEEVKPIVRGHLQLLADKKRGGKVKSTATFKRTVVFSSVSNIKRPIRGPIEIPYVMPAYKGRGADFNGAYYGNYWGYSRSSSNAAGTREKEYLNLRAIAEKEDREEAEWKSQQLASRVADEIDERDVEKVLFSGKFFFTSAR